MGNSLRLKLTIILFSIVSAAILGNWFLNIMFQENYYMSNKEADLVELYEMLETYVNNENGFTMEEKIKLVSYCETNSITTIVVNAGLQTKFYSGYSIVDEALVDRLRSIIFDDGHGEGNLILKEENYTLQTVTDDNTNHSYLEMYGNLDTGDMFVMRMSIESIRDALGISNQLTAYIGGVILPISLLLILVCSFGITARLERLTMISNEMMKLNFNIKYYDSKQDEISILGNNLNTLSDKLESTISELKTANNELKKDIQKKEEIDNMRKDFLSNVSHELKTPLAIIAGYAEGLKESVNEDEESREYYCEVIMDEAEKMNKMVKKLLTLNQIEFGNKMVEMERFDLVTVIDQILNKFLVMIEEKEIEVIFNNKEMVYVWADEFQTEEVITNYISNAINHIDFEKKLKIWLECDDNIVRCTVFNTGSHIPEEELDRIWEKFYKVDKARTREYGGNGIGLSIVKAIMTSMNMECGVKNMDNGVAFWFELEKCAENSNI